MARSNEPIWWSLFSAGGVVSALLVPILVIITGIIIPLHLVDGEPLAYDRMYGAVSHPVTKLFLFALIALPLFHWAHRFRFTLIDVGLKKFRTLISISCYGGAIVGTVLTAIVLWRF